MANNYLITGYWGEPHVTAENDRGINAAIFGAGRFVLPVGERFRAEYIGNNTVRMYDGKLMNNGAAAGIPAGEYIDFLIPNTSQGLARFDLVVFQYTQDPSTLVEKGEFIVLKGEEAIEPQVPTLTQEDLLTNTATFDQMALWRVLVTPGSIALQSSLFDVWEGNGGVLSIDRGGTGASAAAEALENLGAVAKPQKVAGSGEITVTLADNKEYKFTEVTSLNLTCPSNTTAVPNMWTCHGFVQFASGTTPTVSISGGMRSMGDIASAAAGEFWEFSYHSGNILWVNWG